MNGILNEFRKDLGILVSTDVFMDVYQYVKLTKTDFLKLVRFNSYLNIKLIDRTLEKKISKKKLLKFFILKIRLALHRSREVLNFKNF
jgi:spermidine/putrescine-binding protein